MWSADGFLLARSEDNGEGVEETELSMFIATYLQANSISLFYQKEWIY